VETLDFAQLAGAVRERPGLYFHPIVNAQVTYLQRLRRDEQEWERLGWDRYVDDVLGAAEPEEVKEVERVLRQLVEAHVSSMFADMELASKHIREKPGPKGGFKNPYPAHAIWDSIDSATLHATWRRLRAGFKTPAAKLLLRAIPTHTADNYIERVAALARNVVNKDPPTWSALVQQHYDEEPSPDLSADEREWWGYRHHCELRTSAPLASMIATALADAQRHRLRKAGPAGYVASAVLAAHLDVQPQKVQDAIDNYRPPRRSK